MPDYSNDMRFSTRAALVGGYDGHAVRFAKWAENHPQVDRHGDLHYTPIVAGKEQSDFLVSPRKFRGVTWWDVHRRLAPNDRKAVWRWCAQFPFPEEAAAYIDDVVHGRERVCFGGIRFEKHALPPPAGAVVR